MPAAEDIWTLVKKLEDMDFTDDISLLSSHLQTCRTRLTPSEKYQVQLGLKINREKTKVMYITPNRRHQSLLGDHQWGTSESLSI